MTEEAYLMLAMLVFCIECFLLFSVAWAIIYGIRLSAVTGRFGLPALSADANCVQNLHYVPGGVPVIAVLIFVHTAYYLIQLAFMGLVLRISERSAYAAKGIVVSGVLAGGILAGLNFLAAWRL